MKSDKAIVAAIVLFSLGTVYCKISHKKPVFAKLVHPDGSNAGIVQLKKSPVPQHFLIELKLSNVSKSQWFGATFFHDSGVGPNCTVNPTKAFFKDGSNNLQVEVITMGDRPISRIIRGEGSHNAVDFNVVVYSISSSGLSNILQAVNETKAPFACGPIKICNSCKWDDFGTAPVETGAIMADDPHKKEVKPSRNPIIAHRREPEIAHDGKDKISGSKINNLSRPTPKAPVPLVPIENPFPLGSNQKPFHIPIIDKLISTISNHFARKWRFIQSWLGLNRY